MKKIFVISFFTVLLFSSCEDFLDRNPLDSYRDEDLWTSQNDVMAALAGCYSGWESGDNIVYNDCMTDLAFNQFPWEGYEVYASGYQTSLGDGVWKWDYKTIQRCNWFLNNVDKTPADKISDGLKARTKSEARFLRAYQYFVLTQSYGDVPLIFRSLSPAESNQVTKAPKAEVVKFIMDELVDLAQYLPESYKDSDKGRITRGAALGLKSRIELYEGKWADCIATSSQLMTAPFAYDLYGDFVDLFRPQNYGNKEVILDVQYLKNDNKSWVQQVLPPNSSGGWSSVAPTQKLVDEFETINGLTIAEDPAYNPLQPYANRDPRLDATVIRPGMAYGKLVDGKRPYFNPYSGTDEIGNDNCSDTGYNSKKYISYIEDFDNTDWGTSIKNTGQCFIVMRYAEILLNYAEAKIEENQIDQSVYDALNKIRTRVHMPDVDKTKYNTQAKMRELVRRERITELSMEGLRWYDIKRWKIGNQVMSGKVYGCLDGTVNPENGDLTLTPNSNFFVTERIWNDKQYVLPIPQKEINVNKNLGQNDDY